MKYATLAMLGFGVVIGSSTARGQGPAAKGETEMKTLEQKVAYTVGLNLARSMKQSGVEIDPALVARGLRDGMADKPAMTDQQIQEVMVAFRQQMMAKQAGAAGGAPAAGGADAEKNLKDGQAFLAANKAKPGVQTLPSGLQYKVIKEGTGKSPTLSDSVVANYRGTLIDGTEFDSSYKRGEPAEFPVGGVIKGWTEILQKMKVGAKYQVFIPAELAYGSSPRPGGPIKPNDALIFDIELLDVK